MLISTILRRRGFASPRSGSCAKATLPMCASIAAFALACGSGTAPPTTANEPVEPVERGTCSVASSDAGDVRVFAVGHKQYVSDNATYASFAASYRRHMTFIEPCLSTERPNLVAFPENAALGALLIGSRGAGPRKAELSQIAFLRIVGEYAGPAAYYAEKYPDISLARQTILAASDVAWRATLDTFGGIARDYGVWVLTTADVGVMELSSDPDLIALLGDPDLDPAEGVYVATGPEAFNTTLLFNPSGELVGRVNKVFLTDPEENLLDLTNGSLTGVAVFETPFGKIGPAISRDAWYAPYMQRLDDLGADLVVQPEAFSGWGIEDHPGDWMPDVFLSSGWTHQQKYRHFRHSLAPQYTGNFFDLVFDGQVNITARATQTGVVDGYMGQEGIPGWVDIGPWAIPDPVAADGKLTVPERQAAIRDFATEMLPGSGHRNENAYLDSVVAADLALPLPDDARAIPIARDESKPKSFPIDGEASGHQTSADISADDEGNALVVWQDTRSGTPRIHFATLSAGAEAGGGALAVQGGGEVAAESPGVQRRPRTCVAPDGRAVVVWQQVSESGDEVVMSAAMPSVAPLTPDVPNTFGAAAPVTAAPAPRGVQWEPDCGFASADEVVVVWSEFVGAVPRLRVASRNLDDASFGPAAPVDASTKDLPRLNGTQIQSTISNSQGHVVWVDYRDYSWDVYAARWVDGSMTSATRIDTVPGKDDRERLHSEPTVDADGDRVIVAWTDLRDRRAHPDVAFATSGDGGASWRARTLIPGGTASLPSRTRGGTSMPRYRPGVALSDGKVALSFQDLASDKSALGISEFSFSSTPAPVVRLDDTGSAPVSLTGLRNVATPRGWVTIWEDDRDGAFRIYVNRASVLAP